MAATTARRLIRKAIEPVRPRHRPVRFSLLLQVLHVPAVGAIRSALLAAIAAAWAPFLLTGDHSVHADHNPPTATFAIDVDTAGNVYVNDPNGDGDPADNSLVVGTVDFCVQLPSPGPRAIDIVARNMSDATTYDIRLNSDPALARVGGANPTPFVDPLGNPVGFLNLPVSLDAGLRRDVSPANNVDNAAGTAFLVATYVGSRDPFSSPDHPHPATVAEPYAADDPDGVVLARVSIALTAAASGKVVTLDLANSPAPGSDYIALNAASGEREAVPVPDSNLIDGFIAVAPATCAEAPAPAAAPPAGAEQAPGQTTGTRTPAPGETPGPEAVSGGAASPQATAEARGESAVTNRGDEDGSDGSWPALLYAGLSFLALAAVVAGLTWRWRRRLR